jgi:hypothetical protein
MKTMTIRNIPDDVASALAVRARETGKSMNATLVAAISDAFAPRKPENGFAEFCGILSPEEADAVERAIEESAERIDPEDWPGLAVPPPKRRVPAAKEGIR